MLLDFSNDPVVTQEVCSFTLSKSSSFRKKLLKLSRSTQDGSLKQEKKELNMECH